MSIYEANGNGWLAIEIPMYYINFDPTREKRSLVHQCAVIFTGEIKSNNTMSIRIKMFDTCHVHRIHAFIKSQMMLVQLDIINISLFWHISVTIVLLLQFHRPHATSSTLSMCWFLISGKNFPVSFFFFFEPHILCTLKVLSSWKCTCIAHGLSTYRLKAWYQFNRFLFFSSSDSIVANNFRYFRISCFFFFVIVIVVVVRQIVLLAKYIVLLWNGFDVLSLSTHCSINKLKCIDFSKFDCTDVTEPYE